MLTKALFVAGALVLAAAGGTAYAADDTPTKPDTFSALGGVEAEALSSAEMDAIQGQFLPLILTHIYYGPRVSVAVDCICTAG